MKQRSLFSKPKSESPKPVPKQRTARSEGTLLVEKNDRFTQPFLEKMKLKSPDEIRIYEEIERHRLQILIWSKLYYDMDISIVADREFDKIGHELVDLQKEYPEISKIVAYAEEFDNWDASTGFYLPLQDPWVCRKAQQILDIKNKENYDEETED